MSVIVSFSGWLQPLNYAATWSTVYSINLIISNRMQIYQNNLKLPKFAIYEIQKMNLSVVNMFYIKYVSSLQTCDY